MENFLSKAAKKIFDANQLTDLENIFIILPTRRAVSYFKNEISNLSKVPFFAPKIVSIDDFIQELSGTKAIETIELYFEIYEIWKKLDVTQDFEKFLTWIPTVIQDFNLIDTALLENPHLLFKYMSEAEAIKRWELDSYDFSQNTLNYFTFFDRMSIVYEKLKSSLSSKKLSYKGLAYRIAAEQKIKLLNAPFYYFVGLNAFTRAEEKIIESLIRAGKAECIWDSDDFYMTVDKEGRSHNKAGKKLVEYKKSGKFGKSWSFQENKLLSESKELQVFEVSSKVLQSKLAAYLAESSQFKNQALVILDPGDLGSLGLQLKAMDGAVNISAGLAFKFTDLPDVTQIILEFLEYPGTTVPVALIKKFFSNKIIQKYHVQEHGHDGADENLTIVMAFSTQYISKDKLTFVNNKTLKQLLFFKNVPDFILALKYFLTEISKIKIENVAFANLLILQLDVISKYQSKYGVISIDSFKILWKDLTKNLSLPYERQTNVRINVMSMLETRCLDFEEVTFLSFLEGNLPSGKKNNSFFPFDASSIFNLPLYTDQDAIMAYHFYRLLQRAKKINIIYCNTNSDFGGNSEKSRFLLQLEQDLLPQNKNIKITYPKIDLIQDYQFLENKDIIIEKTPEIIEKIEYFLENKSFSATSINTYFTSEVSFYWKYIEGIIKNNPISHEIGSDVFGTIVHHILQKLDQPYLDTKAIVTKEVIKNQKEYLKRNFDKLIQENQENFDFNYGLNAVYKNVIVELIEKYLNQRLAEFTDPFEIIGLEQKIETKIKIRGKTIKLYGIIDKIEKHGNKYVVIDYKTGSVDKISFPDHKNKKPFHEFIVLPDVDKFRQLLVYKLLCARELGLKENVEFRFYSFRSLKEKLFLKIEDLLDKEIIDELETMLNTIVTNLLDENKPFVHLTTEKVKEYLDFAELLNSNS